MTQIPPGGQTPPYEQPGQPTGPGYQQPYPQQYPAPSQGYPPLQYGAPPSKNNGLAIGALAAGIFALVFCLVPFVGAISIVAGIAAVVLGIMAQKRAAELGGRGLAIAGIVMGILGALVATVALALTIWVFDKASEGVEDWDEVNEQLQENLENVQEDLEDAGVDG